MRKKYDVTEDMLQKLHEGQAFKNFTELSTYLGVLDDNGKPLTSDSRKQFMAELDRFVEYRHEPHKQKITIERIRTSREIKPPRPTSGRAGVYSPLIQKLLAFQILRTLDEWNYNSATLVCEEDDIFLACGMINKNFAYYGKHKLKEDAPNQFRSLCRSKFREWTCGALNTMQRNKELSWSMEPYKVVGKLPDRKISALLKSEKDTFHQLEEEAFLSMEKNDGSRYESRQEMFSAGKSKDYYDALNALVEEEFATPEQREKNVFIRIRYLYKFKITQKNVERLKIREDWFPAPAPFTEFDNLSKTVYTYLKTSPKIKGKKTTAQKNNNKKASELWGGANQMLPTYYYFRKRLTQEQVDTFVDAMIKQPKPVVRKNEEFSLPRLNFALIYNFVPDDEDEVAAPAGSSPDDSMPEEPAEDTRAAEQPEDSATNIGVDSSLGENYLESDDWMEKVKQYQADQQLKKELQGNEPVEIDINALLDEV